MHSVAVVAAVAASTARAASLPSAHVHDTPRVHLTDKYSGRSRWWLRAGDSIFYSPPVSMLELSQDAKDYYYAIGSEEALTEEMKGHKVGGEGRWHIFHLPEGPEQLQVRTEGSRRESFSSLAQVESGLVLRKTFPTYAAGSGYKLPGGSPAEAREVAAASTITAASVEAYLTKVTSLGEGGVHSRSSFSEGASHIAAQFLQKEFGDLGLTTCEQKFTTQGKEYSNIVAYIPGRSRDTLTVGAHYDSRPYSGAAPGANDNGSGLSVLLAVAKAFKEANMTPVRDLFLVGFAAEEQGLFGSKAYVPALLEGSGIPQACQPSGSFIQARRGVTRKLRHSGLVLDEIGWRSPKLSQSTVNLESAAARSPLLDHLAQANALHNNAETVTTHSDHPFGSDHMSFISHSLESVLVINGDDEAYPAYHSSSDTMDMVNTTYAAQIGKMVFGGMVREAGLQL